MWLRWLYPRATWRMDRQEKAVYLTFDDGPIPEATPFILDTLKHYGIKATFFMVGDNARKYPELHQRVVDEGHRIGNHTRKFYSVFYGNHTLELATDLIEDCLVQRFQESHVVVGNIYAIANLSDSPCHIIAYRTNAQHSHIRSVF